MNTNEYKLIKEAIEFLYSIEVDLPEELRNEVLERSLANSDWRTRFENALQNAFSDVDFKWMELLANSRCTAADPKSEEDAREIAAQYLWVPTFGNKPVPNIVHSNGTEPTQL